jgi:ketosteroid isomerase-like protein
MEEEVRKVQDDMIAAYLHKDIATLDRIYSDDYTFTRDDGTLMTKRRTLDGFRQGGGREVLSYKVLDEKVHVNGDLAVITYRCGVSEIFDGKKDSGDFTLTRILVRRENRWQMVGGQETRISNVQTNTEGHLVGTWRLVSAGTFRKDGAFEPYPEYGPNARGYLMYDGTGHMCVSLANPNHPRWANAEKPTDAEKLRSYDAFFAYCGT